MIKKYSQEKIERITSRVISKLEDKKIPEELKHQIDRLLKDFPNVKIPTDSQMDSWLHESIPPMVLGWILINGITKVCSAISPAFASVSAHNGIPMFVQDGPGHVWNIGISEKHIWKIDLSHIQFDIGTCDSGATDEEYYKYMDKLKTVSKNPYKSVKITKRTFKDVPENLQNPKKNRMEDLIDKTTSLDMFESYRKKILDLPKVRSIRNKKIEDLLESFMSEPDVKAML